MNRSLFFAALTLAAALYLGPGCSSRTQQGPQLAQQNASNAQAKPQAPAAADATPRTSPDALVADLYKSHDAGKSPFLQTDSRDLVDKYFEKPLADLIWRDAVSSKGEAGALDADPLYDAQDTEIKKFSVGEPIYENGKAQVTVSFENFGEKQRIVYRLARDNSDWKIEEIQYQDGRTLSGMLKGQ